MPPKVLIIGLGSIGRRHVQNLRALGVNDIFAFRSRGAAARPLEPGEQVLTVPTLEAGLARKPDIVFVTNPTAFHLATARAAVRAGAHVFIEKPISHTPNGVEEFLSEAAAAGRHVFVGFNFRFHPTIRIARERLLAGAIGRPVSARFAIGEYLPDWHPWEDYRTSYSARAELGGGVLLTQIHDIDLLNWFFGLPREVTASLGTCGELGVDVEDVAALICNYERLIAEVHLDYLEKPARRCFTIIGTGGKMEWTQQDGTLRIWRHGASEPEEHRAPLGFERNDMFLAEAAHVLAVLRGEESSLISGDAGRDALKIAAAAKRASAERRICPLVAGEREHNPFDLTGRVAIVTGATGLLGREYADELSRAGATVVATDLSQGRCVELAASLSAATGGKVIGLAADITNSEEVDRLVAETERRFGRIDILVNNAAMNPVPGLAIFEKSFAPFEEYPRELWERELAVNVTGPFLLCQRVGALMARQGRGSIINISSTYGNVAPDHRIYGPGKYKSVGYAVTKSAVLNLTRYLAAYWGPKGVRVNTLTPGGVGAGQDPDFRRQYADRTMLGRMAEKNEYRGAILYLASDASSYMTGANLIVDGGWTAW
ncbi:SDR family oxidoreductase [Patescibacteria group bacterium]|nr:MAG: SDR family oxidoreductase [Patescibacteria group bacterium]